ncbi:DUF1697 domain-containing protein [Listeria ivanovii subsp. ivanovii]
MKNYVALLRAVNVVGKNKINMKELSVAIQNAGFTNVKTYIQSGNIILSSKLQTEELVANKLIEIIQDTFALTIDVFVYEEENYHDLIQNNPFPPEAIGEEERWIAFFYKEPIHIPRQKNQQAEVIAIGRVLYVHVFSNQIHTLKLPIFLGGYKKTVTTSRNWRTTIKLQTFLQAINSPE